jgi:hypothetical protein
MEVCAAIVVETSQKTLCGSEVIRCTFISRKAINRNGRHVEKEAIVPNVGLHGKSVREGGFWSMFVYKRHRRLLIEGKLE